MYQICALYVTEFLLNDRTDFDELVCVSVSSGGIENGRYKLFKNKIKFSYFSISFQRTELSSVSYKPTEEFKTCVQDNVGRIRKYKCYIGPVHVRSPKLIKIGRR